MAAAILYSFRRCPFAIRARLALAAAGFRPGSALELREVHLSGKPPELLEASAKGTVPVLVLPEAGAAGPGAPPLVVDESLAVMRWALASHDPADLLRSGTSPTAAAERAAITRLLEENDGAFKLHLDRFKYASRHPGADPQTHRSAALAILGRWSRLLEGADGLVGGRASLADLALAPFVRQFRLADPEGFDREPDLTPLQRWLRRFLDGPALAEVMAEPWAPRRAWRSPRWLYHLALAPEWHAARGQGVYRRSTIGRSLEEVGFIHASDAHQLEATFRCFYAEAGEVLLLTIDPERLTAPVHWEPSPESGERFPHIHGPLPLEAVLRSEPYLPGMPPDPC
jgi:glutathione S-transferase